MNSLLVKQEDFSKAINDIISICEQNRGNEKGGLPYFFYIKIEGLGGSLRLSGQNRTRRIEVILPEVSEHVPFCVGIAGVHLKNLVSALPKGMIGLSLDKKSLSIGCGHSEYVLKVMDKDSFPDSPVISDSSWAEIDLEAFLDICQKISYCSSTTDIDSASYKKGIAILKDYLVCTDGFRLSYFPNIFFPCEEPLLIPADTVRNIYAIYKGFGKGYIYVEEGRIHFYSHNIYLSTALLSGRIPNYKSVMYEGETCSQVVVSADALKTAVYRLAIFSSSVDKSKLTPGEFIFTPENITITTSSEGYKATEVVGVDNGVSLKADISLRSLFQALKTHSGTLTIEIRGPQMPIILQDDKSLIRNIILPHKKG